MNVDECIAIIRLLKQSLRNLRMRVEVSDEIEGVSAANVCKFAINGDN